MPRSIGWTRVAYTIEPAPGEPSFIVVINNVLRSASDQSLLQIGYALRDMAGANARLVRIAHSMQDEIDVD